MFKKFIWSFFQHFSNHLIGFILSIFLTRILTPYEFGLMGMIYFIFTIGNIFIDSGFSFSLIRSEKVNDIDFDTVFWLNLIISIILYFFVFSIAHYIALFFNQLLLKDIIRIFGLSFILNAFIFVPQTKLIREMKFKKLTLILTPSTLIGGIIGVILAMLGFGVWSIVFTSLSTLMINVLFLWVLSDWRPEFRFDYEVLKKHFNFGYKISLTKLIDGLFRNSYNIILGKFFSPSSVGYFSKSDSLKNITVFTFITATNKVTYPYLSKIQKKEEELRTKYIVILKVISYLISPFIFYLIIYAEPIIVLLYTEKWIEIVPYFQIILISGLLYPLSSFNINSCSVKGNSELVLKAELINKFFLIILLLISIRYGISFLLFSTIIFSVFEYIISIKTSSAIINYKLGNQVKDLIPIMLTAIMVALLVYYLDKAIFLNYSYYLRIIIGFIFYFGLYGLVSLIFNFEAFSILKKQISQNS